MDEQEFIEKYGEYDSNGTPRFSDSHAFGHMPLELSFTDTVKLDGIGGALLETHSYVQKFWCDLGDKIADKFGL